MITNEQEKEITKYLISKNLPMDLVLEVKDHMIEQIESKMDNFNKDFDFCFTEVKEDWKKDLQLKWNFWSFAFRTNFQNKAIASYLKSNTLTAFKIYCIYFLITIILISNNFIDTAYKFIYSVHIIFVIALTFIYLFNYKMLNSTSYNYKKKISYLQRGGSMLILSYFQIILIVLFSFDLHFKKLAFFYEHIKTLDFKKIPFFSIISLNVWLFLSILGWLNYLDYKKVVYYLQKRINLKL